MKRAVVMGLAVLMAAALVAAQGKPNFSGSWTLDEAKSTMPQMGGGPGGGRGGMMARAITVKQTDAELTRETQMGERTTTRVYKLDGSESVNSTPRGDVKSKSRWEGAALVTDSVSEMQGPNGAMTIQSTEKLSLDAEGNLVVETTSKTPMGERTTKLVYKKG